MWELNDDDDDIPSAYIILLHQNINADQVIQVQELRQTDVSWQLINDCVVNNSSKVAKFAVFASFALRLNAVIRGG